MLFHNKQSHYSAWTGLDWTARRERLLSHRATLYLKQKVSDTFIPTACCQHQGGQSFGSGSIYIHTGLQQEICNVVMADVRGIHQWGPSSDVLAIQVHLTPGKTSQLSPHTVKCATKAVDGRNTSGGAVLIIQVPYFLMHSATTSYWPMEQAVWRSRGTSSSSGRTRESPSHRERLAPSCSDSLASSLSSDMVYLFSRPPTHLKTRGGPETETKCSALQSSGFTF